MACAIVAFVLGMLCLFAGHKPGFMEDYHIVTVSILWSLCKRLLITHPA
jgi:general stress protein CsbA